jgi:hypothetical protein
VNVASIEETGVRSGSGSDGGVDVKNASPASVGRTALGKRA